MDPGSEVINKFLEELNLKAMESVYELVQDEHRGLITREAVKQGVRAVFNALSGYLSPKTFEAISTVSEEYKDAKAYTVKVKSVHAYVHAHRDGVLYSLDRTSLRTVSIPQYNDVEREPNEAIRHYLKGNKA